MRIAYLNARFQEVHTGGGSVHIEQFVRHTLALGHEMWGWQKGLPEIHTIPQDFLRRVSTLRQMDVLYVRIDITLPTEARWGLPPKRWLYGSPLMVWEFNTHPNYVDTRSGSSGTIDRVLNTYKKYALGCDLAICVSDSLADFVRNELGIKRVLVVPNGSDPDLFFPGQKPVARMQSFAEYFNVVWIGSGKEKWHDLELLKQAATLIRQNYPDEKIAFHLIGPDLVGVMADMPENVFFWGAQPYRQLPAWLSGMQVGLVLYKPGSAGFGSPLKLFDYMASGMCVLSTPSPFMHELSRELDQPGLVVPFGDSERLTSEVINLNQDENFRRRLGASARKLVVERYNWSRAVGDTIKEIEQLLSEKQKRAKSG
jgi:glycosyltransferase involved in cell wall biosynthesis